MASKGKRLSPIQIVLTVAAIAAILIYMTMCRGMSISELGKEMLDEGPNPGNASELFTDQ